MMLGLAYMTNTGSKFVATVATRRCRVVLYTGTAKACVSPGTFLWHLTIAYSMITHFGKSLCFCSSVVQCLIVSPVE